MTPAKDHPLTGKLTFLLLAILGAGFLLNLYLSLHWDMDLDYPIVMYIARLIERDDVVPYRDLFEINVPGTYCCAILFGKIFGYGDLGFRVLNTTLLIFLLIVTWFWMKRLGFAVAWGAVFLFGIQYLGYGHELALEREFIIISPIVISIILTTFYPKLNHYIRGAVIGILFGCIATVKPHAVIGLPIILVYFYYNLREWSDPRSVTRTYWRSMLFAGGGFLIPLLLVFIYLVSHGALKEFWDIARNYWPLYTGLTVDNETIFGYDRFRYVLRMFKQFGDQSFWFIPASTGLFIALFASNLTLQQKRQVKLLIGLTAVYSVYPVIAGQFWYYHWMIFVFFILMTSSLCFVDQGGNKSVGQKLFPVLVLGFAGFINLHPPPGFVEWTQGRGVHTQTNHHAVEIGEFLKDHLEPGDKVQPLDWTGGVVHGMLLADAQLATEFLYDFHFYHHLSHPYIQELRRRFITSLDKAQPRFIIQYTGQDKPWPKGEDTSKEFPELERILAEEYEAVVVDEWYTILEKRPEQRTLMNNQ